MPYKKYKKSKKAKRFQSDKTDLKQIDALVTKHENQIKALKHEPEVKMTIISPASRLSYLADPSNFRVSTPLSGIEKGTGQSQRVGNQILLHNMVLKMQFRDITLTSITDEETAFTHGAYGRVIVLIDRHPEVNENFDYDTWVFNDPNGLLVKTVYTPVCLPDHERITILHDKIFSLTPPIKGLYWATPPRTLVTGDMTGRSVALLNLKLKLSKYKVIWDDLEGEGVTPNVIRNELIVMVMYEKTGDTGERDYDYNLLCRYEDA